VTRVHIYGLPPGDKTKSRIIIFDGKTFGTNEAIRLAGGEPDNDGTFVCGLPSSYRGIEIMLSINADEYVEMQERLPLESLGVFHTVKLQKETNSFYSVTYKYPVEPAQWYKKSQKRMRQAYRQARHKNHVLKGIGAAATIGAAFVGWFVAGILGLVAGCALAIFLILIARYTSGQDKAF